MNVDKMKKNTKLPFRNTLFLCLIYLSSFNILSAQNTGGSGGLVQCSGAEDCGIDAFFATISAVINFALAIGIAFVAIIFAYAGFTYLTAQGDSSKINKAHGMFRKTLVGFLITLTAFLVVQMLVNSLGLRESIIRLVN